MTQFEECLNDLKKWDISYTDGYFYDDNDYETGRWITICGDDRNCLEFDLDGKFQGWL